MPWQYCVKDKNAMMVITPFLWMVDSQSEDNPGNFSIFTVNCWRLEIVPLEMTLTGLPELQETGELITIIHFFIFYLSLSSPVNLSDECIYSSSYC